MKYSVLDRNSKFLCGSHKNKCIAIMAVTMYAFLEAILLLVNAVAVLNEERFLSKIGWGRDQINQPQGFGPEEKGIKQQIANLIHAVRTVMRVPLIFLNAAAIVMELLMG